MTRLRGALAASIALSACVFATPVHAERIVYAIAVGNNQPPAGEEQLSTLRYADDDALRYFELFSRAGRHAALLTVLDSSSQRRYAARSLSPAAPTLVQLQRTLASFLPEMERDKQHGDQPVLFITFSGHGAQNQQGQYFLSFLDGGLTQPILYDDVLAKLAGTEVHLIIDACNADGVVGVRGPFERESEAEVVVLSDEQKRSVVQLRSLDRFPFVGALVAASSGQQAHEWSRIEAGVFSHEVMSALLGGADVNGDLRIEYSEVQAFVMAANQAVEDPRAVPQMLAHAPSGNPHAVLLDLVALADTRFLVGSGDEIARMSLTMPDGRRLLDVHSRGSNRVVLALPSTAGIYAKRGETEAEIPARSKVVAMHAVEWKPIKAVARGSLDRVLRDNLFAAEFTVDYYRGVVDSQALAPVRFSQPERLLPVPLSDDSTAGAARSDAADPRAVAAWVPPALLITSGAALITAAISCVLALNAKADFDRTDQMREAYALRDRYHTDVAISVTAAAVSVATGTTALLLWPSAGPSKARAGVELRGRF